MCGGILNGYFVANSFLNVTIKNWKSVSIWRKYGQDCDGLFFTHGVGLHVFLSGQCYVIVYTFRLFITVFVRQTGKHSESSNLRQGFSCLFLFLAVHRNRGEWKRGVENVAWSKMQGWKTREWKIAGVENAGVENVARSKMQGWKTRECKTWHHMTWVKNAGVSDSDQW